jgi:hypothetical protein
MRIYWLLFLVIGLVLSELPALSQSNSGELRLRVIDPTGLGVKTAVQLSSEANEFRNSFLTDSGGNLFVTRLPFGAYQLRIETRDFAAISRSFEVHSALPLTLTIKLALPPLSTAVTVRDSETLIDSDRAGPVNEIGSHTIQERETSLPGRSLQDLVNTQPGWLYEGNAVLHPRGSEYQTQFVLDGIPLTDNRSPSFGPEIEADDVDAMNIYTAGIPAEYGRKLGGVVEVETLKQTQAGLHGQAVLSGGSFDTAGAFAQLEYGWGKNTLGASADGNMTGRYLNPVVPENFTNNGTTADFSLNFQRELTTKDRLNIIVRHGLSRYEIPNEQIQEAAGQRQNGDNFETMGIIAYQHVFSENVLANLRGMVRDNSDDLFSNALSTPVIAFLHNDFKEGYFNGSISVHHGRHEWKAGVESDVMFLHEHFSDVITDPSQFDPGTPPIFAFAGNRPDLEQAAYVQDLIRLGRWTVSAGLRWDHYQLLVNQNAVSPRLSVSHFFSSVDLALHVSYDRVFQTPAFENILLSSSPAVQSLNPNVLRLPVEPSHGNYYEAGMTKVLAGKLRFDANYFRRYLNNYADDDQILNTAVSFPIAFDRAVIYGSEAKIEVPEWGRFSGFVSYSYIVGNAWFPVTGGLFLGDDAISARTQLSGHFPDSQDQRNTIRARLHCGLTSRLAVAVGSEYGSGLPFDFTGTYQQALAEYGQQMVDRINFARGRVKPNFAADASLSVQLYKKENLETHLQIDGENLNNRLNVIDFGGLFSGNAIAPSRSVAARWTTNF